MTPARNPHGAEGSIMSASSRGNGGAVRTRPLLIAYFPLGDPEAPVEWLDVYAESGVDFIEFGWPAREPYLDGEDVRGSMARSTPFDARAALARALTGLAARERAPRALLMTYAEADHPGIESAAFFKGLDSLLVVGAPDGAQRLALERRAREAGVTISTFLPLPIDAENVAAAKRATGYVMLQAAPGVTGPRPALDISNRQRIEALRTAGVAAPVVLGFGVSRGDHARAAVDLGADGVVVGSAALRAARLGRSELGRLLHELRNGLDG